MNGYEPRTHLPDDWAKKASCPICQAHGLIVSHSDGQSDRMVCPTCQVSFEIAQGFSHIRIMRLPNRLITHRIDLISIWIDPVELKSFIDKGTSAVTGIVTSAPMASADGDPKNDSKSILSSLPKLTQDEVTRRAVNLKALGNSGAQIQDVLARAGATPEQIVCSLEELTQTGRKKEKRQTTLFWVITGAVGVLILIFVIFIAAGGSLPGSNVSTGPTSTPLYLSIPDFSGNTTPTSAFTNDTQAYFRVLWNLQGDFLQRAEKLKSSTPPDTLKEVNQKLIDDYTYAGLTKKAADDCLVKETTCTAPTPDSKLASSCKNITKACSDMATQAQNAYNQLSTYIITDGCKAWQSYYATMNEPWVMNTANGGCRAP